LAGRRRRRRRRRREGGGGGYSALRENTGEGSYSVVLRVRVIF
jgi:hypothetical protein